VNESLSKLPGLAHIPILGAVQDRDTQKTKTELIVMVTPETALPISSAEVKPVIMPQTSCRRS